MNWSNESPAAMRRPCTETSPWIFFYAEEPAGNKEVASIRVAGGRK
jgi:hypothetical protein